MNPNNDFTEADRISPVYCPRCHQPIPRAVSERQRMCDECLAAQDQVQQNALAAQEQARAQVFNADTGVGPCPACSSRNVIQFKEDAGGGNKSTTIATTGVLGCLCFWPVLIVLPVLALMGSKVTVRQCRHCGHRWQV